uniref:Uncharacterized protein n=1 Tax=viral metagenome TaxID=1070528 RepID=A0A6C0BAI0_9ZZZZ
MANFLPQKEMKQFQLSGDVPSLSQVHQMYGQASQLKGQASQLQNQATQQYNQAKQSVTDLQEQIQRKTSQLQGQATDNYNQAIKSATNFQGHLQGQTRQIYNQATQSLKDAKLKTEFSTLIGNLAEKGEDKAIHLLGNTLGVSVEGKTPDQLIDDLNAAVENPETQQKVLEFTDNLIKISKKPLEEASTEAAVLFGNTVDEEGKQAVKVIWDLAGAIPVVGEGVELFKTGKDIIDTGINLVQSGESAIKIANEPVEKVEQEINDAAAAQVAQELTTTSNTPILSQNRLRGGAPTEKQYNQYKKLQLNAANRLSQSFQGFYGTRKRRKGSRKRGPKIHVKTRTRRTKRAKY